MFDEDLARDLHRWTSDEEIPMDKAIYFDMDGTIADLYGVDNWLDKLIACDPSPYFDAEPLVDPDVLWEFCSQAAADGFRIGIVSWMSKQCPNFYGQEIIEAKLAWCDEFLPVLDEIVIAPYGMPKSTCVTVDTNSILIDDELPNRLEWQNLQCNRLAYPTDDMLAILDNIEHQFMGDYYSGNLDDNEKLIHHIYQAQADQWLRRQYERDFV